MNENKNQSIDERNKKKERKMTANKNTFAKTAAIRAGREKRASVANYDPPRCPASNRLKRQRGVKREEVSPLLRPPLWQLDPTSHDQPNCNTSGDPCLCVRPPSRACWTPHGQFPCNVPSCNHCLLGRLPAIVTALRGEQSWKIGASEN